MDAYNNVPAAFPNPDMLQEFSILQNSYSAVYGRDAGAVINMITKSGTNQIHGTAYDFIRNSYVDAKDYFATRVPPLRRNQFGGTIGGPVRFPHYNGRDRTFFFVGAELTRQTLGSTISSTIVPTALERAGNFSQTVVAGKPITVAPPSTVTPANPTGTPFPGNIIPTSLLDPGRASIRGCISSAAQPCRECICIQSGFTNEREPGDRQAGSVGFQQR